MKSARSTLNGRVGVATLAFFVAVIATVSFVLPRQGSVLAATTTAPPPTVSVTINNNATYTKSTAVTLSISRSTTDVAYMQVSNSTTWPSTWESYASSKAWTLTSGDGTKTVYVHGKTGAGVITATTSKTITLDTTPPSLTNSSPTSGSSTFDTSVTMSGTATDGRMVSSVSCRLNSGSWQAATLGSGTTSRTYSATVSSLVLGSNTLNVKAVDGAGNESAIASVTVTRKLLGDCNGDGGFGTADYMYLLRWLFYGGVPTPADLTTCDYDQSGGNPNITDAIAMMTALRNDPSLGGVPGDFNRSGALDAQDLIDSLMAIVNGTTLDAATIKRMDVTSEANPTGVLPDGKMTGADIAYWGREVQRQQQH